MNDRLIEKDSKFSVHKCPVCNGFGSLSFGKKICHGCGGTGYIVINEETGLPISNDRLKDYEPQGD